MKTVMVDKELATNLCDSIAAIVEACVDQTNEVDVKTHNEIVTYVTMKLVEDVINSINATFDINEIMCE